MRRISRHRLVYIAFYVVVLAASGIGLFATLTKSANNLRDQRLAALNAVHTELTLSMAMAQSYVELMQLTAETELAIRPKTAPPSLLLTALKEDGKGNYSLDSLPSGVSRADVGNLTGHGALTLSDQDFAAELEMAFSMRSISREILKQLPNVPWSYYVSARHFEHVYPWRLSTEYSFKEADLAQEYFLRGMPENNPGRLPYVTDVYDDDFGQGLMISMGRPVYADNHFMGIVALDFTLKHIDGVLAKFPDQFGEVYLVDDNKRVIGYSNRNEPTDKMELPGSLTDALAAIKNNEGKVIELTDDSRFTTLGRQLSVLPLTLLNPVEDVRIYGEIIRGDSLEFSVFIGILFLLAFIEWRRRIAGRVQAQASALREVNEQLANAKTEAEEATKAKSSFLAMMSHEIRTPMNGVMSMAEMIDQTELSDDQRSMSAVIRSSAESLLTIINDILDFSKIEAGRLDIESKPFLLADVVENAGELLCQRAEDKGIELAIIIDPATPSWVIGDSNRVRQIIINLLGNGIKFTESGGVTVRVRPSRNGIVRFEVADTGIGLSLEQQGRLFQAFSQADVSTARKYGGTGLGLSISRRLCELMTGKIGVHSEPDKGSTFWFELPLPEFEDNSAADIEIADARVIAVGFHGATWEALDAILEDAGVEDCVHYGHDDDVMSHVVASEGIVLLSAQGGDDRALALGERIIARAPGRAVVLVAPRSLKSMLNKSDLAGFLAAVTLPLRRARVRQVIAAALGRGNLNERASAGEQMYDPPTLAEARAAGAVILVAEDNATNQVVIKRLLSNLGFALEVASDGRKALDIYEPGVHGLLLTDFHMPEMDGFELTAEIRRQELDTGRRIPIIALTADALPGTEQRCIDAGMEGYLTKPIDSKLLRSTMEKWLPSAVALRRPRKAQGKQQASAAVRIDPSIFDVARLKASFGALDTEACAFLANFVAGAPGMVAAVISSMAASDWTRARHHAHALKGAALSIGAVRLGQAAGEVQDFLDQGDAETAELFAGGLATSADELARAIGPLIDNIGKQ